MEQNILTADAFMDILCKDPEHRSKMCHLELEKTKQEILQWTM